MIFDFLQKKGASVELAELITELAAAVEQISDVIVKTSTGKAGTQNVFGEDQLALDVRAENIIQEHLQSCPFVAAFCSEELNEMMDGPAAAGSDAGSDAGSRFGVYYDPLDGSSLVNVNMAVGTIVGIYEGAEYLGRTAREQIASLFAVYGPRTTMMVTVGSGVHEFILLEDGWEILEESVRMDGEKKFFAPGNLRATKERDDYFELVTQMMREQYTLRYSGGMVPDINHILKKGSGVFMYPGMPGAENGKLRLLYECGPMAMLMEQAGGAASAGGGGADAQAILDVEIKELVQRTPIFIGTKGDVARCEELKVLH
jgi:fructose-1,6-bisphosphatase I